MFFVKIEEWSLIARQAEKIVLLARTLKGMSVRTLRVGDFLLAAKRFVEALIIVPAVYLALLQQPAARSIALLSLGRKQGCTLARVMEGDRDIRRQNAPKGSRYSTRESLDHGGL